MLIYMGIFLLLDKKFHSRNLPFKLDSDVDRVLSCLGVTKKGMEETKPFCDRKEVCWTKL